MFEAGSARVRITPPLGSLLAGNAGLRREATGILDHLHANALVIETDEQRVGMVSCDVIGIDAASTARIRERVAETADIPPSNLLLVATHTHTGPQTHDIFREADDEYVTHFEKQVVSAVRLAADDLESATLQHAREEEPRFAHNRRLIMEDGQVLLPTQEFDQSELAYVEGETDTILDVLTVRDADDEVSAVVVAYTTHTDIVTGYEISADFPGWIARTVRSVYGDDVDVLYFPGAAGNVSAFDPDEDHDSRGHYLDPKGEQKARRIGRALAGNVIRAIEKDEPTAMSSPELDAVSKTVPLETRRPSDDRLEAAETVADDEDASLRDRVLARSTLAFAEYQQAHSTVDVEVQVMRLGDVVLAALPGEPFAEFGLAIRGSVDCPAIISGFANAAVGYLPTEEAFDHGGYETTVGWTSRFHPGAGAQLTDEAIIHAKQLARR